jgi:Mg2+ and Co2+ transporter CorA
MAAKDNIVNIGLAADSKQIAAASKRDSSAMKTIAVLTMLFLPATFVAVRSATRRYPIHRRLI